MALIIIPCLRMDCTHSRRGSCRRIKCTLSKFIEEWLEEPIRRVKPCLYYNHPNASRLQWNSTCQRNFKNQAFSLKNWLKMNSTKILSPKTLWNGFSPSLQMGGPCQGTLLILVNNGVSNDLTTPCSVLCHFHTPCCMSSIWFWIWLELNLSLTKKMKLTNSSF